MKKFEKPELEIFYFQCKDIITTSEEHDNGYVDTDDLARSGKNLLLK